MNKVENLKKINLSIQAERSQENLDEAVTCRSFEFIFGLGPAGMTPFEYELADKSEGESVLIQLKKENYFQFFEHLNPPLMDAFDKDDKLLLKVNIVSVASADHKEIVKAMAAMAAHRECDGDCNCGCS